MELIDAIARRQSVRHYKEGDVPDEDMLKILDAARQAPSGKNMQNWHYVVIKNNGLKDRIAGAICKKNEGICREMDSIDREKADRFRKFAKNFTVFFTQAPVLVAIMTQTYLPSGYRELELIGTDEKALSSLVNRGNPGLQSLGASVENLYLRAVDLGYGACWITSANYAAEEIEDILRSEAIPGIEGYFMAALLTMGLPEDNPKSPPKKSLKEIYTLIK